MILKSRHIFGIIFLLIIFEILTPFLIQPGLLPEEVRWFSHILNVLLIVLFIIHALMKRTQIIPVLCFLAIVILSVVIAATNHQSLTATMWGVWVFVRYPFIGFLVSSLSFTKKQNQILVVILLTIPIMELGIQLAQYGSGIRVWDNLGGSFGVHGTGMLLMVLIISLVFFFGKWIRERNVIILLLIIIAGMFCSVLGEMKMYFFGLLMIGLLAVLFYVRKNKFSIGLLVGIVGIFFAIALFPKFIDRVYYNTPDSISFLKQITNLSFINKYTGFVAVNESGSFNVGRNYAVNYVWNVISTNNLRFIFGDGIGSRGESRALGSAGTQLLGGNLGLFTGSSLVVFLGEFGILSLFYLTLFILFTVVRCYRLIRSNQASYIVSLGYAVLLFSAFWPIWLWYNTAWSLPGSMPLYWMMWGVVVHYSSAKKRNEITSQYA